MNTPSNEEINDKHHDVNHPRVVLQINSNAVLERLIGGNSEVELEIRNNIVQAFTKYYLKDLMDPVKKAQKELVEHIDNTLYKQYSADKIASEFIYVADNTVASWVRRPDQVKLNAKAEELIKAKVLEIINNFVDQHRTSIKDLVTERMDQIYTSINATIETKIQDTIKKQFDVAVKTAIQQIVNSLVTHQSTNQQLPTLNNEDHRRIG